MKRWILATAVLVIAAWSASAALPRVDRGALEALERKFNERITSYEVNDPFDLLGMTRGVYLEDYGVVFSSELNLVASAVWTPFRVKKFTPQQVADLRAKKLKRLADIKLIMRSMMVDAATALEGVPPGQRVAVAVTLFRYSWEDSRGLPEQVLMEARRQSLIDFESGKLSTDGLDAAIQTKEF